MPETADSMPRPQITVVTPSFNQGRYIERTIRSVLGQGVEALEYLVQDGGSTDGTVQILEREGARLRWTSAPDRGQADALNKGFRSASAPVIGWLNSDDVYYPGALRAALDAFAAHPEVDVVYGRGEHIDMEDRVIEPYPTEPWDARRLVETCFLCQPAVFFRKSVIERWGLLDDSLHYCMDYEYWLRLARAGAKFLYLDGKVLAGSRLHPETKTLGARLRVHAEINGMFRRRYGATPARWLLKFGIVLADDYLCIPRARRAIHGLAVVLGALAAAFRWNGYPGRELLSLLYAEKRRTAG